MTLGKISKNEALFYAFPIILAILPFAAIFCGEKPIPYFIALLVIMYILDTKNSFRDYRMLLIPFVLYIAIYIAYTLFSGDIPLALKQLERQSSIIIIPFIVFALKWDKTRINVFLESYLIALILIVLYAFFKLSLFYFVWSDWVEVLEPEYLQFKFPHLLNVHPTYWGYLLILGNGIVLSNIFFKIESNKYFLIVTFILLNLALFILSARTPLLINMILLGLASVIYFRSNQIKAIQIISLLILISSFAVIGYYFLPFLLVKINAVPNDERFFLWREAFYEIKNNYFLWGEGVGQGYELLKNYLGNIVDLRENYNGFDLHNQYLKNYLDMGILGFLALIYLVLYPVWFKKFDFRFSSLLGYSVSVLFLVGMFTESALSVLKGIILFAVFCPLTILIGDMERHK